MCKGPQAVEHPVPHESVQTKIRRALNVLELKSHLAALDPTHFRLLDRQRVMLIRKEQANGHRRGARHDLAAFQGTAQHGKRGNAPFSDRGGVGEHSGIADGDPVMGAYVGARLVHDPQCIELPGTVPFLVRRGGNRSIVRLVHADHGGR